MLMILSPSSAYVTFIYNSFWWVDMVGLVDIAAGDVINISCILMGHGRSIIRINVEIHVMLL